MITIYMRKKNDVNRYMIFNEHWLYWWHIKPIYPNATRCDPKKYIVVTLMGVVATEMGQYTLADLTLYSFIKSDY